MLQKFLLQLVKNTQFTSYNITLTGPTSDKSYVYKLHSMTSSLSECIKSMFYLIIIKRSLHSSLAHSFNNLSFYSHVCLCSLKHSRD